MSVLLRVQQAFRIGDQPGFVFCAKAAVTAHEVIALFIVGIIAGSIGLFGRRETHNIIHACMENFTHLNQSCQTGQMLPVLVSADSLLSNTQLQAELQLCDSFFFA